MGNYTDRQLLDAYMDRPDILKKHWIEYIHELASNGAGVQRQVRSSMWNMADALLLHWYFAEKVFKEVFASILKKCTFNGR